MTVDAACALPPNFLYLSLIGCILSGSCHCLISPSVLRGRGLQTGSPSSFTVAVFLSTRCKFPRLFLEKRPLKDD